MRRGSEECCSGKTGGNLGPQLSCINAAVGAVSELLREIGTRGREEEWRLPLVLLPTSADYSVERVRSAPSCARGLRANNCSRLPTAATCLQQTSASRLSTGFKHARRPRH